MNYTTNYNLNKPEGTDLYNHLTVDNPNMDAIDNAMHANKLQAIGNATELVSGTVHAITRSDSDQNIFRFKATGDFKAGDTITVDGVTVNAYTTNGQPLPNKAYVLSAEVVCILDNTSLWVLFNKVPDAGDIAYDGTVSGLSATDVQAAVDELKTLFDGSTTYTGAGTLSAPSDYIDIPLTAKKIFIAISINGYYFSAMYNIRNTYNVVTFGYGTWLANFELFYSANRLTWNSEATATGTKAATWTTTVRVYYTE